MSRWAPVAAGGALLAVVAIAFLRAPERGSGNASAMGGESVMPDAEPVALERPVVEDAAAANVSDLESAADPADREARESAAPERTTIRGRVVDVHTGAPLPEWLGLGVSLSTDAGKRTLLGAFFGRRAVRLGTDGSFEVASARPERLAATVLEWTSGIELERDTVHRYPEEREPDGSWRVPLDVGWLARIDLEHDGPEQLRLEAAWLIEVVAGAELPRLRAELLGQDARLVLYRKAVFEEDPTRACRLELVAVDEEDRRFDGRVELRPVNGVQPAPITVRLRGMATARGRVVDESGEPWAGAIVELLPLFDPGGDLNVDKVWQESGPTGAFRFPDRMPGEYRLRVSGGFARAPAQAVSLRPGENDLGVVALHGGGRCTVKGTLVRAGEDDEADGGLDPFAVIVLRDPRSGLECVERVGGWFELFGQSDGTRGFAFTDVPAGGYELHIFAMDWRDYPSPLRVTAPATDLVIGGRLPRESGPVPLVDARSRMALDPDAVLALSGDRWLPVLAPISDGRPLVVIAPGHRPLRVDSARSELELEPGWGRIVLVRELGAGQLGLSGDLGACFWPPLAAARVVADGREVARSDATGLALVGLERQPARIEFELDGYRTLSARVEDGIQVVLMMRE